MKRIVPLYVHVVSLFAAAGITTLLVVLHAADLTTLGAPGPATAAVGAAVVAELERPEHGVA